MCGDPPSYVLGVKTVRPGIPGAFCVATVIIRAYTNYYKEENKFHVIT